MVPLVHLDLPMAVWLNCQTLITELIEEEAQRAYEQPHDAKGDNFQLLRRPVSLVSAAYHSMYAGAKKVTIVYQNCLGTPISSPHELPRTPHYSSPF